MDKVNVYNPRNPAEPLGEVELTPWTDEDEINAQVEAWLADEARRGREIDQDGLFWVPYGAAEFYVSAPERHDFNGTMTTQIILANNGQKWRRVAMAPDGMRSQVARYSAQGYVIVKPEDWAAFSLNSGILGNLQTWQ